jgi:hypothetical protein
VWFLWHSLYHVQVELFVVIRNVVKVADWKFFQSSVLDYCTDSSSLHRSTVCYSSLQTLVPYTVLQYATHHCKDNSSLHSSTVHYLFIGFRQTCISVRWDAAVQLGGMQCMSVWSHWCESQSQYEIKLVSVHHFGNLQAKLVGWNDYVFKFLDTRAYLCNSQEGFYKHMNILYEFLHYHPHLVTCIQTVSVLYKQSGPISTEISPCW